MNRFIVGGIFVNAALLIVGLSWIGPQGGDDSAEAVAIAAAPEAEFRSYGEDTGNVVEVELDAFETV